MAITLASIQTELQAIAALIISGDYSTAYSRALAADVLMAGIPDSQFDGQALALRRQLTSTIKDLRRLVNANQQATYGIQSTKVTYRNADC